MEFSSTKRPATATAPESVHFRLLCPASRTGAIIGKGGSVIRYLQSVTGSKIRVIDDIPVPSEERVVLIIAPNGRKDHPKKDESNGFDSENPNSEETKTSGGVGDKVEEEEAPSSGQMALLRVLERIMFGDDAASADGNELDKGESEGLCRMIVRGNQVDFLMSKGGKMMQRVREDSGATVWISPTDQIPPCAFPGDVVIQVYKLFCDDGNFGFLYICGISVLYVLYEDNWKVLDGEEGAFVDLKLSSRQWCTSNLGGVSVSAAWLST